MSIEQVKKFKNKINTRPVIGMFSKTSDPAIIECIGFAGFDFVIIDMEHGPNNLLSAQDLVRAAELSDVLPIARIKEDNFSMIGQAMDIGFGGLQIPKISEVSDIKRALEEARFAPEGNRGVCRFVRSAGYSSIDRKQFFTDSNNNLIILQVESKEVLQNIDDILNFGSFDILFIGPYDLSQSFGHTGETRHPLVEKTILEIVNKCEEKQKIAGIFADKVEDIARWIELGIKYIAYSVDVGLFYEASKNVVLSFEKYSK